MAPRPRSLPPNPEAIAAEITRTVQANEDGSVRVPAPRLQALLSQAARRGAEEQQQAAADEAQRRESIWPSVRARGLLRRGFALALLVLTVFLTVLIIDQAQRGRREPVEHLLLESALFVVGAAVLSVAAFHALVWLLRPRIDEAPSAAPWIPPGVSELAVQQEIARLVGPDWQRQQNRIGFATGPVTALAGRIAAARRGLRFALLEVWGARLALIAAVFAFADNALSRWQGVVWSIGLLALVAGYWVTWLWERHARDHLNGGMAAAPEATTKCSRASG